MIKYNIGDIISGKVTGIEKYGIFLSLADGSSGLIHISEISDQFVRNVSDYVVMGETIKARVIGYDENNHYKLSIKNFEYKKNCRNYRKIVETSSGFSTLGHMLKIWIEEKNKKN